MIIKGVLLGLAAFIALMALESKVGDTTDRKIHFIASAAVGVLVAFAVALPN